MLSHFTDINYMKIVRIAPGTPCFTMVIILYYVIVIKIYLKNRNVWLGYMVEEI